MAYVYEIRILDPDGNIVDRMFAEDIDGLIRAFRAAGQIRNLGEWPEDEDGAVHIECWKRLGPDSERLMHASELEEIKPALEPFFKWIPGDQPPGQDGPSR